MKFDICSAGEDDIEAELQKLSVTMRMNLDSTHCSSEVFTESMFHSIPPSWFHVTVV